MLVKMLITRVTELYDIIVFFFRYFSTMGEQPIYTTKAHIFQIDATNKKQWVPLSSSAVFVQFIYDSQKNIGRIISADSGKAILNSTLHSNVSFLKTSQKFGQWADPKAVTVYGVGFGTETDLNRFSEKFKDLREMVQNKVNGHINGNGEVSSGRSHSTTSALSAYGTGSGWRLSTSCSMGAVPKSHSVTTSLPPSPSEPHLVGKSASVHSSGQSTTEQNSPEKRLNSQQSSTNNLNVVTAQNGSSTNGIVSNGNISNGSNANLELELGSLRLENNRLQNSYRNANSGMEEWKQKAIDYRDEVHHLRKRVAELELIASKKSEHDSNTVDDLQRLLNSCKAKLVKSEDEQRQMSERLQQVLNDREELQRKYDDISGANRAAKQLLAELHHNVLDKAEELTSLANKLSSVL